jgi:DNA processing protein
MVLSSDSQVVILLCSRLGLAKEHGLEPLTLRDWNPLAAKIRDSSLERPGALLEASAEQLQAALEISDELVMRLRQLLDRSAALAIELDRLESLGIWVLTRADDGYPIRFSERLKSAAPAVLFGCGPVELLGAPGLAIVGSRDVDEEGIAAAEFAGQACARSEWSVYSGAARGVDEAAMKACIEQGGSAVGILADSLEKAIRAPFPRQSIGEGNLTLVSPYAPKAPFSVGMAMGRNKLIYAAADFALVIASDAETGGTWSGATEALKAEWCPVFVRDGENVPEGNRKLIQRGALPYSFPGPDEEIADWMKQQVEAKRPTTLF